MLAIAFFLAAQAAAVAPNLDPSGNHESEATARDVYTECFLRELSALEGRDVANSTGSFTKKKAMKALRQCSAARTQLITEIERQLASDPVYSDKKLRAIELQNRVALKELPLMLLVHSKGR